MYKIIKESIKITNENIVIATPLILFSLLSTIYLIFSTGKSPIAGLFTIILFFLMLCAFLSGWLYMIMKTVKEPDIDKNTLITESFFSGVGEYFLPAGGMIIVILFLSIIIFALTVIAGKYFIGNPGVTYTQFSEAMTNVETMKNLLTSLSQEQLLKINLWNSLIFFAMTLNYFLVMFYAPAMYFKKKNPFIAFFVSLKDLFSRKFFANCGIYILVTFGYFLLSILTTILNSNIFAHFVLTLLNFYFVSFCAVLIFNFYHSNYAKIGSNIDQTV